MAVSRREFLKLMGTTAVLTAFSSSFIIGCKKAIKKASKNLNVIWIHAQSCGGCSDSLYNVYKPTFFELITKYISINYHSHLMAASGELAQKILADAKAKRKDYILIIEGSIPDKNSAYCTTDRFFKNKKNDSSITSLINDLSQNAKALIAVGSCASFGGIPAAHKNSENKKSKKTVINNVQDSLIKFKSSKKTFSKIINLPGCPPHPDWIAGTLLSVYLGKIPKLDSLHRPLIYYSKPVHSYCEHLNDYKRGKFAKYFGDEGCLYNIGCLGIDSNCDSSRRGWLNKDTTCMSSGSGCIGCTEKVFPDYGGRGLYNNIEKIK